MSYGNELPSCLDQVLQGLARDGEAFDSVHGIQLRSEIMRARLGLDQCAAHKMEKSTESDIARTGALGSWATHKDPVSARALAEETAQWGTSRGRPGSSHQHTKAAARVTTDLFRGEDEGAVAKGKKTIKREESNDLFRGDNFVGIKNNVTARQVSAADRKDPWSKETVDEIERRRAQAKADILQEKVNKGTIQALHDKPPPWHINDPRKGRKQGNGDRADVPSADAGFGLRKKPPPLNMKRLETSAEVLGFESNTNQRQGRGSVRHSRAHTHGFDDVDHEYESLHGEGDRARVGKSAYAPQTMKKRPQPTTQARGLSSGDVLGFTRGTLAQPTAEMQEQEKFRQRGASDHMKPTKMW